MTATAGPLVPDDPSQLGDYELLGRLGEGGMGVVYLGSAPDGREVAIKVIRAEIADDHGFRSRFGREIEAASRVDGVFTARVLDADVEVAQPYFVTEYIEGPTLKEAITASGPLSGQPLVALAVGIAEAVGAVHTAGIVHRDLKPSNVLLAEDGPMVIDFGIAQPLDEAELMQAGMVLGTPVTMAPERYHGDPVTPAADVFSWGCVVAYAANGGFPFGDGQAHEIGYRILNEEPNLGGLEGELRELVELALAKDPARRPTVEYLMARLLGEEDPERQRAAAVEFVRHAWPLAGIAIAAPWGLATQAPSAPAAAGPSPFQAVMTVLKRAGSASKKALTGKGASVGQLVVQHKVIAAIVGAAVIAGAGLGVPRVLAAKPADATKITTTTAGGGTATTIVTDTTLGPTTTGGETTTSSTATTTTGTSTGGTGATTPTVGITASASEVSASPATFRGTCPTTVTFTSTISVNRGPVTVSYQWVRSSGGIGDRTLRFSGTGAQSAKVEHTWKLGTPGETVNGSVLLRLLSPSTGQTARRGFTLNCSPPPPEVHASGTFDIPQTWVADMDEGKLTTSLGSPSDVWFHAVTATERYFEPVGGATAAITGSLATSPSQCASAGLSSARINVSRIGKGTTLCMRTGAGRYSAITVIGGPGESPGTLTVRFTTWE